MSIPIITRFAPSPTGNLHIGGARTALFNWLFAKANNGKFVLRIEDTDLERSTEDAKESIFSGLSWLGLEWDGEPISQKKRIERHQKIVELLLQTRAAYKCYSTKEEIIEFQEKAKSYGNSTIFESPWREENSTNNNEMPYVVRLKSPRSGLTKITDLVKGEINWNNETLDDLVLLRADGSPTYMLAVVVDDYDMKISHVIRGDDHLTNTARQVLIYNALSWRPPQFAHLPLIHGFDGAKLSKRHAALGVSEYEKLGYSPQAIKNYLARLGWSHGDEECFNEEQAIKWFSLKNVGKSPAKFDFKKLDNISKYHINLMGNDELIEKLKFYSQKHLNFRISINEEKMLSNCIEVLKARATSYKDLLENAKFLFNERPIKIETDAMELLTSDSLVILQRLTSYLENVNWTAKSLNNSLNSFAKNEDIAFPQLAKPLRVALTGVKQAPSIDVLLVALGKEETLARLSDLNESFIRK